ncbi:MAG: low molecular weight phosphotyrosine protein phosphatase [Anaerolineales bacterium]|nr:low molecular weight phosphotyrosine protein phosphatase [Anaerolineales bacterium]
MKSLGIILLLFEELILLQKTRILFVCLGNIVRSPLAENMFRYLVTQAKMGDAFEIASAGTGGWHVGESPDGRMRRVAAQRGLIYNGSACQFSPDDFEHYDWIIAMDRDNRANLLAQTQTQAHREKVHLMREFDPLAGRHTDVPDPYYGGLSGFEEVYDIIERACRGLFEVLQAENNKVIH